MLVEKNEYERVPVSEVVLICSAGALTRKLFCRNPYRKSLHRVVMHSDTDDCNCYGVNHDIK